MESYKSPSPAMKPLVAAILRATTRAGRKKEKRKKEGTRAIVDYLPPVDIPRSGSQGWGDEEREPPLSPPPPQGRKEEGSQDHVRPEKIVKLPTSASNLRPLASGSNVEKKKKKKKRKTTGAKSARLREAGRSLP